MAAEISSCLEILDRPGIILYPTDTIWGLGCRASDSQGVSRIYELKRRPAHKAMLCLVSGRDMLCRYVGSIRKEWEPFLQPDERPTTIIYPQVSGVAPALLSEDGSLGIRLTFDPFCRDLIRTMDEALVSTSANLSGEPNPSCYADVSPVIVNGVDYIVNLRLDETRTAPSRILRVLDGGAIEVIRA